MNIIDPRGQDVGDWIDTVVDLMSAFVPVMILRDAETEWKMWGYHVRHTLRFRGILVPDPGPYDDWAEWAMRFNQTIATL